MMIRNTTADLIDAISNRELVPFPYSGRHMYGRRCVACKLDHGSNLEGLPKLDHGSNLEGLPKVGAMVDQLGKGYLAYWPEEEWTDGVQEYVDTIRDPSGKAE